jgi:hypothetical protein
MRMAQIGTLEAAAKGSTSIPVQGIQSCECRIKAIPAKDVMEHWQELAPYIQLALDAGAGHLWLEDVQQAAIKGLFHLIAIHIDEALCAVLVTELCQYPRKRALRVILGGGIGLDLWATSVEAYLQAGAEAMGCDLIEIHGRPGWRRYLSPMDVQLESIILTRPVRREVTT